MADALTLTPPGSPWLDAGATFSKCGRYRYVLWRVWNRSLPSWLFIGANPSKADAVDSDPTVSGQVNRGRALRYGALYVVNARSWVSTDPKGVPPDPELTPTDSSDSGIGKGTP